MAEQDQSPEKKRRDWVIILIILLFGLLCVILAGGWAIRFAPTWRLDTDMGSYIDPNSDFLTNRPNDFIEPLDPSILTQPSWINIFLTPGAVFPTNPPITSLPTNTPLATTTTLPTIIPPTNTPVGPSPTNTFIFIPQPPTNTPKPPPPAIPVDLSITKTDGAATYTPGSTLTYTVVVTNNSSVNVNGVTINDTKPSQVTTWGWCVAPCTPTANTNADLNTTINLAAGNSITYSILANIDPGATGDLVNTASVSVPSGYIDTNNGNSSATDTDTISSTADLQITKDDLVTTYTPGGTNTYGILVYNDGPDAVTGATVNDILPAQISSASWTCTPLLGASCSSLNGSGNIVNHSIDLPVGSSVAYSVTANIHASAVGDLVNTASVSVPAGYTDTDLTNNSDNDIDTPASGPDIDIGGPDGNDHNPGPNGSITILFSPAVTADGTSTPDFVYYEILVNPTRVDLDWVMIEISSDGSTWYTVFVWGDGTPDTNSNVDINVIGGLEDDNRQFNPVDLYNQTGVTIDIDAIPGITTGVDYPWMRISGIGGSDGPNIDAIQPYYP